MTMQAVGCFWICLQDLVRHMKVRCHFIILRGGYIPSPTALYAISVRQARVLPIKGPFNP